MSLITTIIGTFGVYAATGGKIEGIPATDWLGIRFSDKYVEYKQPVENQIIAFEKTTVELTSTVCNEGITILEFNLKLSDEDYKKLRLGESVITDEYLQYQEQSKTKRRDRIINDLKMQKYNEQWAMGSNRTRYEDIVVTEEEISIKYEEELKRIEEDIEERRNTGFTPALSLNYMQEGGVYNYDKFNPNTTWYASIYIDDTPYFVNNMQKIEKISDCEYKIYQMYTLDDDVVGGKESFKITLKNNKLVNLVNWQSYVNTWRSSCQWFATERESSQMLTPKITVIDLPGEFEVNVSKDSILNDSLIIENPDIKSEFRNITQTVEKVVVSPIQTIVKVNHSATHQSSKVYANRYENLNIEHLPLTREYKVYDDKGNELNCFSTSNKHTLIYSNGVREDYDPHDIPNKKYNNATWETVQYLLIENTDTEYIKIVPIETVRNPVEGVENNGGETYYEMDPLIINVR